MKNHKFSLEGSQRLLISSCQRDFKIKQRWRYMLCIFFVFFLSVPSQKIFAVDDWDPLSNSFTWNLEKGVIEYNVRYFQTWGGLGEGRCGAAPFNFTQNTNKVYKIKLGQNNKGETFYLEPIPQGAYTPTYTIVQSSGGEYSKAVKFSMPVSQKDLNCSGGVSITVDGTWWREGAATDQSINYTDYKVMIPVEVAEYKIGDVEYVKYNNNPCIAINWTRTITGNASKLGNIVLCNKNGNQIVSSKGVTSIKECDSQSGVFYVCYEDINLNEASTYKIKQTYIPSENNTISYTSESNDININAFPQITDFHSSVDYQGKKIKLEWKLNNAPTSNYDDSQFVITVTKTEKTENDTTFTIIQDYKGGKTSYDATIEFKENEVSKYNISIKRENKNKSACWESKFQKNITLNISSEHCYPVDVNAKLSDDNQSVELSWTQSGSVWTDGSVMKIIRTNVTNSSTYVFELKQNEYEKGSFRDDLVTNCNEYSYEIRMIPGGSYKEKSELVKGTLIPTSIGTVKDFSISKGYYSDMVLLRWRTTSSFDEIAVERREYQNESSVFDKIQTVKSISSSNYVFEDKSCLPGVLYEYRVYGLVNCAKGLISSVDTIYGYGFRTPTGDFYGRVTYENGQSVDSVEIRLNSDDNIDTYALSFENDGVAEIEGGKVLSVSGPITMQAWINPSKISSDTMRLIRKSDIYEVGLIDGKVYFIVGDKSIVTNNSLDINSYTHVTSVFESDSSVLKIFINGELEKSGKFETVSLKANGGNVFLGENYEGLIDEVRLWSRNLSDLEINSDYTRYLIGDENSLDAYYTFDFVTTDQFYDRSFKGTIFNENHGTLSNVGIVTSYLTRNQLTYKGYTREDGTYTVRAVPYYGNGTAYTLTPRKGIHQFTPTQEIRFISEKVPSHTVNFVDNSSFSVTGKVCYSGGNYPVEGVQFKIDGVPALSKTGEYIKTNETGDFTLSVPVGIHEVKAVKDGHTFELDGRICMSDSLHSDRNYQDSVSGVKLYDNTKVKYIGRICGGSVQEELPVGFSLSKNNMAKDMKIVLSPKESKYDLQADSNVYSSRVAHPVLTKDLNKNVKPQTTLVDYNRGDITIHVNDTTGEFIAWVYPIEYNINLSVYGYGDESNKITGDGSSVNLTSYAASQYEKYEYQDTLFAKGTDSIIEIKNYTDSVDYRQKQVFNKRNRAKMEVTQLSKAGRELAYFGAKEYSSTNLMGEETIVPLYVDSTKQYTFGIPAFIMNETYNIHYRIFEEYPYYKNSKKDIDEEKTDKVDIEGASVAFNNKMASYSELDTINQIYTFKVDEPDMTTAKGTIAATFTYGDSENPTSVSWENPMGNANGEALVLGSHQTGTNFVTGGPNQMLCVLRDPPGSNSYSYLEKGTSFTTSSSYTGSFNQEGSETWNTGFKSQVMQITTVGVGAQTGTGQTLVEDNSGISAGIVHEEEYTGSNSKSTNTTLTTRIQTSEDPIYDGANGDVYVGYSTNISFGTTNSVMIVPIALYDSVGGDDYYEVTYAKVDSFAVVKTKGISAIQNFNTMFAYPQIYIEQTLIPNLEDLRNSLLLSIAEVDTSKMQAKADADQENYYVSLVPQSDPTFGQENSYVVYYTTSKVNCDTIHYLNQSIESWENELSKNDSIKVSASKLLQNYSFQAGANIEYSESYSSTLASSHSFSVKLGVSLNDDYEVTVASIHSKFEFEETFTTTQGGEFADEAEASHSKGFVLAEDGDDDYLSVDVLYEDPNFDETYVNSVGAGSADTSKLATKSYYPTFVFRTRGGATSCPYEDAYKAIHWKGHESSIINAATMKLEEPSIDMPQKFIENVPSGEDAYLTVYMKNNSETGEDQWFDLRMVDSSNPYGAIPSIDGNSMSGFALEYLVPAGDVIEKTIAITKGSVLNYDNLAIALCSKCQADPTGFLDVISDTVYFSVHFIPSCTDVAITQPSNNWTYNTNCAIDTVDGLAKHYMPISISGFDVNYTDFEHIELQYKSASGSDDEWITLAYYYKEDTLTQKQIKNGFNAFTINPNDGGVISYNFFMDALPDQNYDIRAVSYCNINNELYENPSEIVSGIKDMYNPRLFGSPKPANGVLTIDDDIRIDFNETIAEGMLISDNFEVTGIRNGATTDHDVAIDLDGENDYLVTEATRNFANKDLTFECWVNFDLLQNATFFSHGDVNKSIEMGMNKKGNVIVKVGDKEIVSEKAASWEKSSWNHVALVYDNANQTMTAYVNYVAVIDGAAVDSYLGNGVVEVGRSVSEQSNYFNGKVDQFRIWNEVRSSSTIQANCNKQLSGNDVNLIAYYEMDEAKGNATEDKARGANLVMKGGEWALPEGRSASFDGKSYIALNTGSSVIASDMDFTLEFWFNAASGAKNQTILSSGDGVNDQYAKIADVFSIGFDSSSKLEFRHNGQQIAVNGNYADNNWHNFTLAVSRSSGIARIYMDGELNTYFDADMVGRIASDVICAGAHYWHTNIEKDSVDQFFTGKIDEIRLWKLYRQQSQIESFYNQKVNGDEMGLLLYYPFEHYITWQGTPEMQFTLEDKANPNNGKANKNGNVTETTNIPPVKTIGAVSPLLFDWVVNDDALIINLKEQDSRIEKTIVNFTVNKIQDVNGNYIVSPITWSAYISRNQLKWMDDVVKINKKENEPYTFEMPIVNNGGSVINYNLQNMPSWLSASSESGSINPLEKKTLEFEIDPSLAVGSYDEVVYLSNSNNVTEPLKLNVVVEGNTPDWSVDPSKYEYNMVVFAQVKIDNVFSNDEKDMLAAFYQGECVGVAHMSYDKTLDMWSAMLTVYSNSSSSHHLEYRIWDASNGMMLSATSSETANFVNDKVIGKPNTPVVFSNGTIKYQNIQLGKGWNWVSFNLSNKGMSELDSYLESGVWGANSIIKNITSGSANYSPNRGSWVMSDSAFKMDNKSMYKIYSDVEQTLSVSGSELDLTSVEIPVNKSWNYISYLPSISMTLKTALSNYDAAEGDLIKSNDGFAMYYGNEWIGSLNSLQPNSGYMLKNTSSTDKTFKYPTTATSLRSNSIAKVNSSAYESNMNIVAFAPQKEDGDVVRAMVGDKENEVVEIALNDEYALQFITVSAKDGDNIQFVLDRKGETFVATNQVIYAADDVYGSPKNPVVLNFNINGSGESLAVYPNPVVDDLTISGVVSQEGDALLELFDVAGSLIYSGSVSTFNNVLNTSINMTNLIPGSYMLKVTQNEEVKVFKIVKE